MMTNFHLRFSPSKISELSNQCVRERNERDRQLTEIITTRVFPSYKDRGYLTKFEFLTICEWKTSRSKKLCAKNDPKFIEEVSRISLSTKSDRMRIQVLQLLTGVGWPTASVFLHFAFENRHPIIDYRALWSLNIENPPRYSYELWKEYTVFCRQLALESCVTMRVLDQALWKYSELYQK